VTEHKHKHPAERRSATDRRHTAPDLHQRLEDKRLAIENERRAQGRRHDDPPLSPHAPDTHPTDADT
jgi:hypothetical protein